MFESLDELQARAVAMGLEIAVAGGAPWRSLRATGQLDGRAVELEAMLGQDRNFVIMRSFLDLPLNLGLSVRRSMTTLVRGIPIAVPGFDAEHHVDADEAGRAQQLLDEEACAAIAAIGELGGEVELTDMHVVAKQGLGFVEIESTLEALVRVAKVVRERVAVIDPPTALARATVSWKEQAEREGGAFLRCPLSLRGADVIAFVERVGLNRFHATARVTLDRPLDVGVTMRPARFLEPLLELFQGKDLQIGDASFDRAFTLAARDREVARAMFTSEVRNMLLSLAELGEVRLDDVGLELGRADADDVPRAVELMRGILERARQAARSVGRIGPYR